MSHYLQDTTRTLELNVHEAPTFPRGDSIRLGSNKQVEVIAKMNVMLIVPRRRWFRLPVETKGIVENTKASNVWPESGRLLSSSIMKGHTSRSWTIITFVAKLWEQSWSSRHKLRTLKLLTIWVPRIEGRIRWPLSTNLFQGTKEGSKPSISAFPFSLVPQVF